MFEVVSTFGSMCIDCLTFGTSGFYLLYATVVLLAGLVPPGWAPDPSGTQNRGLLPGDIGRFHSPNSGGVSIVARCYVGSMEFFSPQTFLNIVEYCIKFIRWVLGLGETGFDYWSVFKRLVVFYFLIIPLPAAFLAPVGYAQAQPDIHLLTAVVLLIFVNAIGDLISTRITIRNFEKILLICRDKPTVEEDGRLKQGVFFELKIYLITIVDMSAALAVLFVVLVLSSILFGIQIGAYRFGFEFETLASMWDRAIRFPELFSEMYWFRDYGESAEPEEGIPGMLIYGASTFVPTIIMLGCSLIWSATIPLRIALQLPKSRMSRIFSAELSVFAVCLIVSGIFSVNVPGVYSFLTTIWAI